jgi:prophage regulatory protein
MASSEQLLNVGDVCKITTLSKASIYRLINQGEFPPPVKISSRRVAWTDSAVQSWRDSLRTRQ